MGTDTGRSAKAEDPIRVHPSNPWLELALHSTSPLIDCLSYLSGCENLLSKSDSMDIPL
jgi:hypothetical protein